MSVSDNYGARWVKAILNWTRIKTMEGYEKEMLIKDGLQECGLRKNKTIELVNEFIEMGLMKENKGKYYWGDTAPVNIEMKPYLKAKKKIRKEQNENDLIVDKQRAIYQFYVINCKKDNEEPLDYDKWLIERKGDVTEENDL